MAGINSIDIAAWYEKYGPMVIRRCQSILRNEDEALDAVHDVFVKLLEEKLRLHGSFPSSLLYTMATNICLNKLRRKKLETQVSLSFDAEALSGTDKSFIHAEDELLLEEIFKDESEQNRAICYMYHADGMTLKEIGDAAGLSVSGVRKRLKAFESRARVTLRISGRNTGLLEDV